MDVTIRPAALRGTIPAIASKSMAHRLLIMAALCPGTTDINCNATSKDIEATVSCLEALGARIASTRLGFRVNPLPGTSATDNIRQATPGAHLDCGESGCYAASVSQGEVACRLDGVADGVPEVEGLAPPVLALVLIDHVALDLDVSCHDAHELVGVKARLADGFEAEPLIELLVRQHTVLDHLAARIAEQLRRDGRKAVDVGNHERRLQEGAREVLSRLEVHGGLAAHRGVDHGEKGRWHLDHLNAALVEGGGESSHVTRHASAKRNHGVGASEAGNGHALQDAPQGREALVLLACGEGHGRDLEPCGAKRRLYGRHVERGDVRV